MLTQAVNLLTTGGTVFVGDVRNLRLLQPFTTVVQMHRVEDSTDPVTLRRTIEHAIRAEKELLVDPEFFPALQDHLPHIAGIDIQIKRGHYHNELTQYRYDVLVHKHPVTALLLTDTPQLSWGRQISDPQALTNYLNTEHPQQVRITGIPNTRLSREIAVTHALQTGAPITELKNQLHTSNREPAHAHNCQTPDPETLHALGLACLPDSG